MRQKDKHKVGTQQIITRMARGETFHTVRAPRITQAQIIEIQQVGLGLVLTAAKRGYNVHPINLPAFRNYAKMIEESIELLPCPFCGAAAGDGPTVETVSSGAPGADVFRVACRCGASIAWCRDTYDARAAWNKRR
jgi:hypothetical protein